MRLALSPTDSTDHAAGRALHELGLMAASERVSVWLATIPLLLASLLRGTTLGILTCSPRPFRLAMRSLDPAVASHQ